MIVEHENIDSVESGSKPLPLIVGFRKDAKTYIDDEIVKYLCHLKDTNTCECIIVDSLHELPKALSREPQCLVFYADGLFDQHTTVSEFVMMLKSMMYFTVPDNKIKIAFAMDRKTPHSFIKELQKTGISGIVPSIKDFGPIETTKGIEALINGIPYWPKHLTDQLPGNAPKPKRETVHLTARQKEVLELIANRGLSNKQIARVLGISESTVKIHVSAIMKAYCVRNRTQLALTKK